MPPNARNTDPDTSHAAASVTNSDRLRSRVFAALRKAGYHGMTDDELVDCIGTYKPTTVTSRGRLSRGGLVADSGIRRKSHRGCDQIVWVLAEFVNEVCQ